ncbi:MAG: class B sortase [Coriobacteriia bacterium]|nr:class B sortase [Coriobacteriia bacterium]
MAKMFRRLVLIAAVAVMAFALWQIYSILSEGFEDEAANHEIAEIAGDGGGSPGLIENFIGTSSYQTEEQLRAAQLRVIDFAALRAHNADIVAWISIPNTIVDYAITQTSNNEFYLHHDAFKRPSRAGAIFLDKDCPRDFSASDTIVYGHHMRNRSMFGSLNRYADSSFANGHRYIFIYTAQETRRYTFSTAFRSGAQLDRLNNSDTQVLSLVTCNYTGGYSHFVVRANLLNVKLPGTP